MPEPASASSSSRLIDAGTSLSAYLIWLLVLIYALVHGPIFLLGDALFWDDWILKEASPESILTTFQMAGGPWVGPFHLLLMKGPTHTYHAVVFLAQLVVAVALFRICLQLKLDRRNAFWIAVLFIVIPLNIARVARINVPSELLLMLFFIAWERLNHFAKSGSLLSLTAAVVLFPLSFGLVSLIGFFLLPVASFWFLRKEHDRGFWLTLFILGTLPVLFFIAKNAFMQPFGYYAGYNTVRLTFSGLLSNARLIISELFDWPSGPAAIVIVSVFLIIAVQPFRKTDERGAADVYSAASFFWIGIIALALGFAPYLAADKAPMFKDWGSRLQILLPLGSALVIWSAFAKLQSQFGSRAINWFCAVFCLLAATTWVKTYADLYVDWLKQISIVRSLERNDVLKREKAILLVDEARNLNALGREYRFYELAGFALRAYGDQGRIFFRYAEFANFEQGVRLSEQIPTADIWLRFEKNHENLFNDMYLMNGAKTGNTPVLFIVSPEELQPNKILMAARFLWFRLSRSRANYLAAIDSMITARGPVPLPAAAR